MRLSEEVVGWVDDLAAAEGTGHEVVLDHLADRIAWEVYQGTWAPLTLVIREEKGTWTMFQGLDPMWSKVAQETLHLYGWHAHDATRGLVEQRPELAVPVTPDAARVELAAMAQDLVEVKGLLVRGYRPEDHIVALPGGGCAAWTWDLCHRAGAVVVASDEVTLREDLEKQHFGGVVRIGLDGRAREVNLPWKVLDDEALPWTVGLLRELDRVEDRLGVLGVVPVRGSGAPDGVERSPKALRRRRGASARGRVMAAPGDHA